MFWERICSQTLGEKEESFLTKSSGLLIDKDLVSSGRSGGMVDAVDLRSKNSKSRKKLKEKKSKD